MARERTRFGGVRLGRTRRNRAGGRSGGRSIGYRGPKARTLNAFEQKLQRLLDVGDVDATLRAVATSGVLVGKRTNELQNRSGFDNARLWKTHRTKGRDPFVYDRSKGMSLWAKGAVATVRSYTNEMIRAAVTVAEFMLEEVERNVSAEKNMKPLATKYAKWKQKYYYGKPILMLTGQLVKSLKPHVIVAS